MMTNSSVVEVKDHGFSQVFREEITIRVAGDINLTQFGAYVQRDIFSRLKAIDNGVTIHPSSDKIGIYSIGVMRGGYTQIEICPYDDDKERGLNIEVWGKTFVKPVKQAMAELAASLRGMSKKDLLVALNADARMPKLEFYLRD